MKKGQEEAVVDENNNSWQPGKIVKRKYNFRKNSQENFSVRNGLFLIFKWFMLSMLSYFGLRYNFYTVNICCKNGISAWQITEKIAHVI